MSGTHCVFSSLVCNKRSHPLFLSLSPFLSDTLYFFSQTPFLKQKIPREEGKEARKRAQLGLSGGGQEEIRLKSAKRKYLVHRGDLGFNRQRESGEK